MQHVQNIQYVYLLNKYLKCSVWRLALRYDIYIYIYIYMSLGFKRITGSGCSVLILHASCRHTCITYASAECTVSNS